MWENIWGPAKKKKKKNNKKRPETFPLPLPMIRNFQPKTAEVAKLDKFYYVKVVISG